MSIDKLTQTREAILEASRKAPLRRTALFKRESIDQEARTVRVAFSSEEPVERYFGIEILDHSPKSVDLSRLMDGGPGLVDHDPRDHVATIEECSIDSDRVGRATLRFGRSERAEEIFQDVVDGIRKCISVGYQIHRVEVEDPDAKTPSYRATLWEPYEISFVSIPADTSVGVGRSEPAVAESAAPAPLNPVTRNAPMSGDTPAAPPAAPVDVSAIETRGATQALARVNELLAMGDQYAAHGGKDLAAQAVRDGKDVRWLSDAIMARMAEKSNASPAAPDLGLNGGEQKRYSLARALNALATGNWKDAGFERECHEALVKRDGEGKNGGILVPYEIQKRQMAKRDMNTGANGGGYLVETVNDAASFIDLLRNRTVVGALGATMLSGLKGNITIPKLTAAGTAYWLANETTAITEANQTIGQLAMSPKNVGAYTEYSRQLMLQSSPAIDMLIMNDLARVIAIAIDLAALEGNGSGAPVGIANTAGIGSVTGGSLAWADILEFQSDVAAANALAANCAYVTTPAVAALLAERVKFSSTASPIWEGSLLDGTVAGFRAAATNQLTAATMIFGDFSQVVIGEWGTLELAINPVANFAAGIVGVRAFQTVDVGIRYAGAFSRATSIT